MAEKFPMQADGEGTKMDMPDDKGELASRRSPVGESGGGAYPNPHSGEYADPDSQEEFTGGQSKG